MENKAILFKDILENIRENQVKKLDFTLSDEPILKIPDEIYELSDLEEINFGEIPITQIPPELKKLTKLKTIFFKSPEIEKFPLELIEFGSLENVGIRNSKITSLPKELNTWSSLTYLSIIGASMLETIQGIPKNLTYLQINEGKLHNIPELIFGLDKLAKLVFHNLKLSRLPLELFSMNSLTSLFVGENDLSSIPDEIVNLSHLTELILYSNSFYEFPESITGLEKLKTLRLDKNYLKSVSINIKRLSQLQYLDLADNNFKAIPDQVKDLKKLKSLKVNNLYNRLEPSRGCENIIKEIPDWISDLTDLKKFEVDTNAIENIPIEILIDGIEAIRNFIVSKREADTEELLYEAKMVIVGRGNVGKTVLTKKLTTPGYSLTKSDTTIAINILKNPFVFPVKTAITENDFKFNIWDFGGQEKYDATHQLFITNRSIYLFLTEAREESNYSDFQFWLNTIRLFSNNSPVIVILSKCDERKKILPELLYKEKFENIVSFVDVSCADGYEYTIENLRKAINEAVLLLPQTTQTLSNRWVDIRNELEKLSIKEDYISYEYYLNICKNNKLNEKQADFLSQYLNDLGVIVHHQYDLLLKRTVFVNTDWCVDGMYKVLDNETVLNNNGKFTNKDLQNIWADRRFESKQEELIKLMKEYNLCFELKDSSGYIAPDLLPPDKPTNFEWDNSQNLQFEYRYDFMPAGILSRFVVKSHSFVKKELFWKHGVVLDYDNTQSLIQEDYINCKIKVFLRGENKKGLLSAIRMLFEDVHKDFNKTNKLVFEEMIPCNCSECLNSLTPHFYKFNVLKRFEFKSVENITCEKSVESVVIRTLIDDIQTKRPLSSLESNNDLKNFIIELLTSVLEKDITMKDGFVNFWRDNNFKNPKNEIEVQPYICNTLDNFCKIKGINMAREVREANGSVDVLFSYTNHENKILKVCVEIKKAHHQFVETAVKTQLPLYMKSADTDSGIYLVVWFKYKHFGLPTKYQSEEELIDAISRNIPLKNNISVKVINCTKPINPSLA